MRRRHSGDGRQLRGGLAIAGSVLAVTAFTASGLGGGAAAAQRPTISQARQQVNKLTSQYDRAGQQYDSTVQKLRTAKKKLARLDKKVSGDKAKVAAARVRVAQIAATSYENGNMTSVASLLTSGNPQAVLNQASILQEMSGARAAEMKLLAADEHQLRSDQTGAQHTVATLTAARKRAAALKKKDHTILAKKRTTLDSLTARQRKAVDATSIGANGSTSTATYSGPTSTAAGKAIAFVYTALDDHTPYVWGGTGPAGPSGGFDCSGLVQAAWSAAGVSIPRTTYAQWATLPHVSTADLKPGDLLFYNGESHVAMYVGNGYIIDAPQTGMDVERIPMNTPWYADSLDGAARP